MQVALGATHRFGHAVEVEAGILQVAADVAADAGLHRILHRQPSFAKLRPEIEKKLMQEETQKQQELWLAGLRQKAFIQKF